MISPAYRAQVDLLLRVLPYVAIEESFALKGGTAINLFVRDMPRFSVDIDLTYLPFDTRDEALREISDALRRIKSQLEKAIPGVTATVAAQSGGQEAKLICGSADATIKIEVNTAMRGHLWPARKLQITQAAQDEFGKSAVVSIVSDGELYGGKICAALDRQHPRDLFDVHQLFANEGITDTIHLGFLASLVSHSRPIHEVIRPNFQDQRGLFETHFAGMAIAPFTYDDFKAARKRLVETIHARLTGNDRAFLLSFKNGEPDWELFPLKMLQDMPAVQWKLSHVQHLKQKNRAKHAAQLKALEEALST
jgi:predicted nucleotidyltransferase component of viral defense system